MRRNRQTSANFIQRRNYSVKPMHLILGRLYRYDIRNMERAGAEDMGDDVERKGLGTPAIRADIEDMVSGLIHTYLS